MRVAAVQYRPPKGHPAQARAQLVDAIDQAGRDGARMVVCPEMATTGYIWPSASALRPHAETIDGPTAAALGEVAAKHGAWVFCGFPEVDNGDLYNSMMIVGPSGAVHRPYRKILLYEADLPWAQPGEERMVVETAHGAVMPGICMDLNDPEFCAALQLLTPRVLAFCTNWVDEGVDPLLYWRMRVFPWRGWFIAANTWGEDMGTHFCGLSTIFGPSGRVHARAEARGDGIILTDID